MESDSPLLTRKAKESKHGMVAHAISCAVVVAVLAILIAILVVVVSNHHNTNTKLAALEKKLSDVKDATLTYKYNVPHATPRRYQGARGTCWDFGTMAPLSHAYRLQGIKKGYLDADEYMAFSEQAYGNLTVKVCSKSNNKRICETPGDNVAFGSTEGGETHLLYEFKDYFKDKLLPDTVCPYLNLTDDSACPGIDAALEKNPISFKINKFLTLYERNSIKHALRETGQAMSWSTPVWTTNYYRPCTGRLATDPRCAAETCTQCPQDGGFPVACCVQETQQMYTMDGEFVSHHTMVLEAGHAMTVFGYNDGFKTKSGPVGGWIIRNSWGDGMVQFDEFASSIRPRGSHSIAYWMQEISEGDERLLCPNSHNPRNWFWCDGTVEGCTGQNTIDEAKYAKQPVTLHCRDESAPEGGCIPGRTYHVINATLENDGYINMCMLEVDPATQKGVQFCHAGLNSMPWASYSIIYAPIGSQSHSNHDDFCGYYFMPYEVQEEAGALFGGYYANAYEVTFTDSSYAKGKHLGKGYSYEHILSATHKQTPMPDFTSQYPNDLESSSSSA